MTDTWDLARAKFSHLPTNEHPDNVVCKKCYHCLCDLQREDDPIAIHQCRSLGCFRPKALEAPLEAPPRCFPVVWGSIRSHYLQIFWILLVQLSSRRSIKVLTPATHGRHQIHNLPGMYSLARYWMCSLLVQQRLIHRVKLLDQPRRLYLRNLLSMRKKRCTGYVYNGGIRAHSSRCI